MNFGADVKPKELKDLCIITQLGKPHTTRMPSPGRTSIKGIARAAKVGTYESCTYAKKWVIVKYAQRHGVKMAILRKHRGERRKNVNRKVRTL